MSPPTPEKTWKRNVQDRVHIPAVDRAAVKLTFIAVLGAAQ
jgi:hypothetical protein